MPPEPAEQFSSFERQVTAARVGMWAFLASEVLLFAGLFALYGASRTGHTAAFDEGVGHMNLTLGTVNTVVLLCSSFVVAVASPALRSGRRGLSAALVAGAVVLGAVFLVVKGLEYRGHFAEGIYPGGRGAFFTEHHERGLRSFFTLYYVTTGLHAVHVTLGMAALTWVAAQIVRRRVDADREHPLELVGLYWHLVDVVWIFLWPLYYLVRGA